MVQSVRWPLRARVKAHTQSRVCGFPPPGTHSDRSGGAGECPPGQLVGERGNGWVFAGERASEWSANEFEEWRQRRFGELLAAAGVAEGRPYDLVTPSRRCFSTGPAEEASERARGHVDVLEQQPGA
jgi:hypothetical protein